MISGDVARWLRAQPSLTGSAPTLDLDLDGLSDARTLILEDVSRADGHSPARTPPRRARSSRRTARVAQRQRRSRLSADTASPMELPGWLSR